MFSATVRTGVVAIGRNEGERLRRCLLSLQPLGLPIVYVDSASTDGSAQLARELGAEVVDLDLSLPFTAARARNAGFARLEGVSGDLDYVQFVDGDCEVAADWIAKAVSYLDEHPDVAVVCGRRREKYPDSSRYNAYCDVEWNTPVGEALACGGDSCMRIADYKAAGGFDDRMVAGEEPELCHRLRANGGKIMRLDAEMTLHDAAISRFRQWWLRAVRNGFGSAQAWNVTRKRGEPIFGRLVFAALFWAGVIPLTALMAAVLIHPTAVLVWPLATFVQFLRVARRTDWNQAWLLTIGKYAELMGIARYARRLMLGRSGGTIVYK